MLLMCGYMSQSVFLLFLPSHVRVKCQFNLSFQKDFEMMFTFFVLNLEDVRMLFDGTKRAGIVYLLRRRGRAYFSGMFLSGHRRF